MHLIFQFKKRKSANYVTIQIELKRFEVKGCVEQATYFEKKKTLWKNIIFEESEGKRPTKRPNKRWWNEVQKNMTEMGVYEEDAGD